MDLSQADFDQFAQCGLLKIKNLISKSSAAAARDFIFAELERLNIKVQGKYNTSRFKDLPTFQQSGHISQLIKNGPVFERLYIPQLLQTVNHLANFGLKQAHPAPQLLVSLPQKDEWSLKNLNWHVDYKPEKIDKLVGIQAFILIDDLKPQGGATLAIAGSHKLHFVRKDQSAYGVLQQDTDFASNPEKFLKPRAVHGIETQIVEFTGCAGDVYLMDLRVLHSPSVNSSKNVRMMTTNRYLMKARQ